MVYRREEVEAVTDFLLLGSKVTVDGDCSHETRRWLLLGKKAMTNLDSVLKSRHHFADKGLSSKSYGLSSGHVWLSELYHKESRAPKNWCFWTVVLEKTLESPLNCKEIQPVHPKGSQSWIFTGRTDAEAELQYFGHLIKTADSLEKTLMLGKTESRRRGQQRVRWLDDITIRNRHELGQTLGDGEVHGVVKSQTRLGNWTTTVYLEDGNCSVNIH